MSGSTPRSSRKPTAKPAAAKADTRPEGDQPVAVVDAPAGYGEETSAEAAAREAQNDARREHAAAEEADPDATDKPVHADDPSKDFGGVPLDHRPSDETGDTDDDDFAGAKIDSGDIPRTAQIEPPAEKIEERKQVEDENLAAAAVDRMQEQSATVTEPNGDQPDPGAVFGPVEADGRRVCRVRLVKHSQATIYDRSVTTLLAAVGQRFTERDADSVVNRLRAERA